MACYDNSTIKEARQKNAFFGIRSDLLICLVLSLFVLGVYWQVKDHDFINFDDNLYVTENEHVQSGINLENVIWAFRYDNKDKTYWHPMTWLSHMLDCHLYGLSPGMHHSTNVLFHIANTLLLFLAFRRMTGALWKSAMVAALFGLHPLNVESVAWVAERKNVLSTFFWMLTIVAYIRYSEKPAFWRYLTVFLLFILGQMAKPMLVTLPFVLLLLDYWPLGRLKFGRGQHLVRLIIEKLPLLILSAASVYISIISHRHLGIFQPTETIPILLRIENALVSYILYIVRIFWPHNLAVYYPFPDAIPLWQGTSALLALLCTSFLILIKLRHIPSLTTGWLWYLGTIVPVIGLVQAGLWPAMADRWAYIPAIGIYVIIVWGTTHLFSLWHIKNWAAATASVGLIFLLLTSTWLQLQHWKNGISLFRRTIDLTNSNYYAHYALGYELFVRDRNDEAIQQLEKALQINPKCKSALEALGAIKTRNGEIDEVIRISEIMLTIDPNDRHAAYKIHNNLANTLARHGRLDPALNHYSEALRSDPSKTAEIHNNIGAALIVNGRPGEAISHLQFALQEMPDHANAQKNLQQAVHGIENTLQSEPQSGNGSCLPD